MFFEIASKVVSNLGSLILTMARFYRENTPGPFGLRGYFDS